MSGFFETTVRVRYAETDQMGVVYHSNFFIWFELGRVELFRALGFSYKQMENEDDCHMVVTDCQCSYKRPARYDDVLNIRTRVAEARSRKVKFEYEVVNSSSGELLATGETTHIICGSKGQAKALPLKYRAKIAPKAARA